MQLRFVSSNPAIPYYLWQVETFIKNFMDMGINPNMIDIVCSLKDGEGVPEEWGRLAQKYPARFFFYPDTRETKHYISSIRPNVLKQHFKAHPYLENEAIFYHDCDIVFTRQIDWNKFLQDDKWYGSDCRWYVGHSYIVSKGGEELDLMCKIMDIDPQIVQNNELNSIGAQYLMKGIDHYFWEDVERHSENMFHEVTKLVNSKKQADPTHHELQIWTADMWAVLWNAWKRNHQTVCHSDFNFSWATSHISEWDLNPVYHNAGAVSAENGMFYKGLYQNSYPPKDLEINPESCSYNYYQLLKQL